MNTAWMAMDIAAGRGALGVGLAVSRPRPTPGEQPRLPEGGPVREVRENREPDEMPRSEHRLTPHQLPGFGNSPSRRGASEERPR